MFDLYRDSLEDVIDSNIDDEIPDRNNSLQLSKLNAPAFWLEKAILLLSRLLGNGTGATNSKGNNSSIISLGNLSPKLPSSIVPNNLSNSLLKSNNCKLWKIKKSFMLMSGDLGDSSYNAGQSTSTLSQNFSAVNENNTDSIDNS